MKQNDIENAIVVQKDQLEKATGKLSELNRHLKNASETEKENRNDLNALDEKMANMFNALGINQKQLNLKLDNRVKGIQSKVAIDDSEISDIEKRLYQFEPIEVIEFTDWKNYKKNIDHYLNKYQIDLCTDPIRQMLSPIQIAEIEKNYNQKFGTISWNEWDYGVIALSVICAFLVDYFVIRIPNSTDFLGKKYEGSPLTKWLREKKQNINPKFEKSLKEFEKSLKKFNLFKDESLTKVPFDKPYIKEIKGLKWNQHRLMTPGHDPILGFIFGTFDIMKAQMTVIDKHGKLNFLDRKNENFTEKNIFIAFTKVFAHLLSDIFTTTGIQPPFFTVLQLINGKSPFILDKNGERVSYTNVARYMYKNGYTMEHFLTMSLVPLIIEVTIRSYYLIANFDFLYNNPHRVVSKDFKLCSMLTLAHNLTMSSNVVKMWMYGWNPSTFNWSELLILIKSFFSLYRATQDRKNAIENHLYNGWTQLYNLSK